MGGGVSVAVQRGRVEREECGRGVLSTGTVRHLTLYVVDGRRPAGRAAVLLDLGGMARIHAGALHTAAGGCSPVWGSAQAQLRQYSSRGISGIRYFRLY